MPRIPFRKGYGRDWYILKAICLVTDFAMEMDMGILVILVAATLAQFVADTVPVLDHMHKMMLAEQHQRPEYSGLVDGIDHGFKFDKGHRPPSRKKRLGDN